MKRNIKRAIRKLEEDFDGGYIGFITAQDLIHLVDLGLILTTHHKGRVESAQRDKKAGTCFSDWQYFSKPKKEVIKLFNEYLDHED